MTPRYASEGASGAEPARILHIIPEDGIGGVEVIANQAAENLGGALQVHYLRSRDGDAHRTAFVSHGSSRATLGLRNAAAALRRAQMFKPDIVVFSLWKTVFAFLLLRFFLPGPRLILFVHSARSVHLLDRMATALMARLSHSVWTDSTKTARGRVGEAGDRRQARVISFVRRRPSGYSSRYSRPSFLYWGRLHEIKRVDRAIDLFSRVAARHERARFRIVGPDAGSRPALENQVAQLGLGKNVEFIGPLTIETIEGLAAEASFFIQLSSQEGAAMSVIEAMQFGLVPIVTPVGAIADYCVDGANSILFDGLENTADRIEEVLDDQTRYRKLRESAIAQWKYQPVYHDDILTAAAEETGRKQVRIHNTNPVVTLDQY